MRSANAESESSRDSVELFALRTIPPVSSGTIGSRRPQRPRLVLTRGAGISALLTLMLSGLRFALNPADNVWLVLAATSVGLGLVAWSSDVAAHKRYHRYSMPLVGWLGITGMAVMQGGLRSDGMFWMTLVPIAGILCVGRRAAIPITALVSITVLLLACRDYAAFPSAAVSGDPGSHGPLATLLLAAFACIGAAVFSGALGWFYEADGERAEKRLLAIVSNLPVGVAITNAYGIVTVTNRSFRSVLNLSLDAQQVIGHNIQQLTGAGRRSAGPPLDTAQTQLTFDDQNNVHKEELKRLDGRTIAIERVIIDVAGLPQSYLWSVHDVTERAEREAGLRQSMRSDAVTGLATRAHFADMLERACKHGVPFAVMYLDLDGFKAVNDSLGHHAGDMVLTQVGARLQSVVRDTDLVARLGGDEFALIVSNVSTVAASTYVAQKIVNKVNSEFEVGAETVHIGVSVGIALYPAHATTAHALVAAADQAMYSVKRASKAGWAIAEPATEALIRSD